MSDQNLRLQVIFDMMDRITGPLRRITADSSGTAQALKAARDRLKELNTQQGAINQFRELKTGLATTTAGLGQAQQKVRDLALQMRSTTNPTRAMTREFEKAKAEAKRLKEASEQQARQLQVLRDRLTTAGVNTRNLSQHERTLRNDIINANQALREQEERLRRTADRMRRMGEANARLRGTMEQKNKIATAGAGMLAAGAAGGALMSVPVGAFAQAEDSATQLKVALMRAGSVVPPEFEKINALAMKLGDRLPGTTSDFQDMMTMLNRQGISAQSIMGGMGEATAYLGVQLKKAPADAAEFAAKMQDATTTTERDMMGLMDVIQRAFYLGVDDTNMLQGFSKMSAAMDTIKIKGLAGAKALAPFLVMADQAGMEGEAAGNAYRKVFQLSMDKDKIGKTNKLLGKNNKLEFTDGKGEFAGFDNMYKQLDKLKNLTTQTRLSVIKTLFGDDAETLQVVSLLIDKGASGYAEVQAKMAAQASLQERVNTQLGTLKNLWDAATGTFTNGMVAFGESIAPELKSVTKWIGDMSQKMGAWARDNPRLANALMKTAAGISVLLVVLGALLISIAAILIPFALARYAMAVIGIQGGLMTVVLRALSASFLWLGRAIMWVGRAFLMNPIGLAVTAIAVAAFLIYKYWGPLKEFFSKLWSDVASAFDSGWGTIKTTFSNLMTWFDNLPGRFTTLGTNIMQGLANGITNALGMVKSTISGAGDSLIGWFKDKLGIHSPSRVFSAFGGYITEGLAIGIDKGQDQPLMQVSNMAKRLTRLGAGIAIGAAAMPAMAFDTRPPVTARGQAASYDSHDTVQIHIAPMPGMDPQAIARAVAAELDRRDRAKAASVRSSLHDY